ncbi:uncharacterized protein [Cicer arietinum]|uniref:Uncharacterized protein LOC101513800 n=1 Tax=Cicer arietinum TaxID=3827 RepID=A0A1S2Y8U9_CICAR|nr:uncharacterized protein LOC101513800 [Cicer arietinum]XP_012571446.1 uncharacterized protein LOC101513800 [Cicer arietinum]XP_027190111.1 uncharacterized protein LOC101513800 [Cicer arietinum]XP_027190112.1 uncharacterized protein LOC101513800 [Cicer arietinum]XP_027190113.1 uncharacterized protein LOC101513800 [Cicer arietinum]XP_027190114.1 uncharacterized protein LOC101513800 [Cicer arietinum]XP_027190115.1 uncharacterized protein LOC101513800 [Cicer arietinum]XP_027190116.1 uncharacte
MSLISQKARPKNETKREEDVKEKEVEDGKECNVEILEVKRRKTEKTIGRVKRQRFKSINKCTYSDSRHHDRATNKQNMNIQQNSNSSKNFDLISKLPQELMLAILSLVPLKCLLNSARHVSKPWATAIQACLRGKPPGIYIEIIHTTRASYFLNIQDYVKGHSERIYLGLSFRFGEIVAISDGMFLLCDRFRLTYVVNPIIKCCFRIPPLPFSKLRAELRSTIACVPRTGKFKVFLIDDQNVSGVNWYVFNVLRIGIDNTWKEIVRKEVKLLNYKGLLAWKPVHNGDNDIYWITEEGVIVMDVDKEIIIREYPLPPQPVYTFPLPVYLWTGDCLSFIMDEKDSRTYQIYTLDMDSGKWTLYHEIRPFHNTGICSHKLGFDFNIMATSLIFRFWINDQIIFIGIFVPNPTGFVTNVHFCYNIKTRQVAKIDCIPIGNLKAWLHTPTLTRC